MYMEFIKMVMMALYTRQQKSHRYKEQLLDSVGKGKGGVIWENIIETCIFTICEIDDQSKMHETEHSKPVHWDYPEGWEGEGGWRGVRDRGTQVHHTRFMSMYNKNHHNIVKKLIKIKF